MTAISGRFWLASCDNDSAPTVARDRTRKAHRKREKTKTPNTGRAQAKVTTAVATRPAGQSKMSFGSRLPVRSDKRLQFDVVVLPSPAIMRFRNSVVGVECSATNSRRRIYFEAARGRAGTGRCRTDCLDRNGFLSPKLQVCASEGGFSGKNQARAVFCLLWETLRSHLAIRRQKNPLGGHTDHLQPS